jgi:hypothetical protein
MFVLLHLTAVLAASPPIASSSTLTGVVRDQTGQPVNGATILIRTAKPRDRVGVL